MSADNKAIVRRLIREVWNRRDVNVLDDIVAANYVGHDLALSHPDGTVGFKESVKSIRSAPFPMLNSPSRTLSRTATLWFACGVGGKSSGRVSRGYSDWQTGVNMTGINIARVSGGKQGH
jgi:hypothetical protein